MIDLYYNEPVEGGMIKEWRKVPSEIIAKSQIEAVIGKLEGEKKPLLKPNGASKTIYETNKAQWTNNGLDTAIDLLKELLSEK